MKKFCKIAILYLILVLLQGVVFDKSKSLSSDNAISFIKDNKLYIYEYPTLTLYEITYNSNNLSANKLSAKEIKKLYPYAEIIKLSDVNDNYLHITKHSKGKKYMLISDVDNYYSGNNYQLAGVGFNLKTDDLLPIFTINQDRAMVVYAKWGELSNCEYTDPCLTIEFGNNELE